MQELVPFVRDLAIMLGIASVVVVIFQKIKQPVVLGYILTGVIIGPYTLPFSLVTEVAQVESLAELGVIFLMFAIGLEFSFHRLKRMGFSAITTGVFKVLIVTLVGYYLGRVIGWEIYESLFFGAALSISSTTIIIKEIEDSGLKNKRFAEIVFGVLIVEDLLAVLMLTSLSTVVITKHFFSLEMLRATAKLFLVIGSWFVVGYFVMPILFRRIIKYVSEETLTIVSISLCVSMATIAAYFHYSAALGAFIMGSILAETPFAHRIQQLTRPVRDVFAAVFFISVGMLINLRNIFEHWGVILLLSLIAIMVRVLITTLGTFLTGQGLKTSIRAGFSMAPIGEFSFIIMGLGISLGVVSASLYQVIIGVATITTLVSPYLMKISNLLVNELSLRLSDRTRYFLESYAAWVYRAVASYQKKSGYRQFVSKLISSSIIIAVIFGLAGRLVLPQVLKIISHLDAAKIYSWLVALLFSAPFIWRMFFSYKVIDQSRRMGALFLTWMLTIAEIIVLSVAFFSTWYIPIIIALAITVVFKLSYSQLDGPYRWLERQFLLISLKKSRQTEFEELAPWEVHLVELMATNLSTESVVGRTIAENQIKQRFGVNIVAIKRSTETIFIPTGKDEIKLNDELIVLGNDEQIDYFRKYVEKAPVESKKEEILKNLSLKAMILEEESPYIGKSIRESEIRKDIGGTIVGLERLGVRTKNPDSGTILKANDLLLIVGRQK